MYCAAVKITSTLLATSALLATSQIAGAQTRSLIDFEVVDSGTFNFIPVVDRQLDDDSTLISDSFTGVFNGLDSSGTDQTMTVEWSGFSQSDVGVLRTGFAMGVLNKIYNESNPAVTFDGTNFTGVPDRVGARTSSQFGDLATVDAPDAATVVFELNVTGTYGGTVLFNSAGVKSGISSETFLQTTNSNFSDFNNGTLTPNSGFFVPIADAPIGTSFETADATILAEFPVVDGMVDFGLVLTSNAIAFLNDDEFVNFPNSPSILRDNFDYFVEADFGNTLEIVAVSALNDQGAPVPINSLVGQGGTFDYTAIPEPTSAAVIGLMSLVSLRRRH
jgi:hypothetical protein